MTLTIIKNSTNSSLSLQDPRRGLRHAVDAPVRVTVLVADGDREPPVVGPDDLNRFTRIAKDGHRFALATISSFVLGSVRCLT